MDALNYLTEPVFLASSEGVDHKLCATAAAASQTHIKLIVNSKLESLEPSGPRRSLASACILFLVSSLD